MSHEVCGDMSFKERLQILYANNLGVRSSIRFAVADKLAKAVNKPSINGAILLK